VRLPWACGQRGSVVNHVPSPRGRCSFKPDRRWRAVAKRLMKASAVASHEDLDPRRRQVAGKSCRGELRALIRVENLRFAEPGQGVLERDEAERRVHRVGDAPRQNRAAGPINDRDEIEEAGSNWKIGDIRGPNVVRPLDFDIAQEMRENLVARHRL